MTTRISPGAVYLQWKTFPDGVTVVTGDGQYVWCVPSELNGWYLSSVSAFVSANSTSGNVSIQLRNITQSNVDILSTALTIDANEPTSNTAATPAVIDTTKDDVYTGDLIAVDVDSAGTLAKGLGILVTFKPAL